ncbi:hypothetical protein LEMLEM_LOCUS24670 [Lemmus lemmus]
MAPVSRVRLCKTQGQRLCGSLDLSGSFLLSRHELCLPAA